jgi:hypothetical protein
MLIFNVTPLSTLTTREVVSLIGLHERIAGWKNERFGSPSFRAELREFNDRVALAALAEPVYWSRIFGNSTRQIDYEPEELGLLEKEYNALGSDERKRLAADLFDRRTNEQRESARAIFERAELNRIEYERRRLCEAADVLEGNRDLQTTLRTTRGRRRSVPRGGTRRGDAHEDYGGDPSPSVRGHL